MLSKTYSGTHRLYNILWILVIFLLSSYWLLGCAAAVLTGSGKGGYEQGHSQEQIRSDARITTEINTRLVEAKQIRATDVRVSTINGNVTLRGKVSSPDLVERIIGIAWGVKGVKGVVSRLELIH